jgi:hypothetical protein
MEGDPLLFTFTGPPETLGLRMTMLQYSEQVLVSSRLLSSRADAAFSPVCSGEKVDVMYRG